MLKAIENMYYVPGNRSDPVDGNLSGTFVRRIAGFDRRLAPLGRTFSEADIASFSLEWTPQMQLSGFFAWPSLGFFDTTTNRYISGIKVKNGENAGIREWVMHLPDGSDPTASGIDWVFGDTYLLDFELDGPALSATISVSMRVGGSFIHQFTSSMSFPGIPYQFDALGMGNIVDGSGERNGNALVADIDNFSFTPEPSTAFLLTAASLLILRQRRPSA